MKSEAEIRDRLEPIMQAYLVARDRMNEATRQQNMSGERVSEILMERHEAEYKLLLWVLNEYAIGEFQRARAAYQEKYGA